MVKIGHRIQKIITLICLYVKPVLFAKKYKISTQASKTLSIKNKIYLWFDFGRPRLPPVRLLMVIF